MLQRFARPLALPVIAVVALEVLVRLKLSASSYAVAPSSMLSALFSDASLGKQAGISLIRLALGIGIGAVVGATTGLVLAESRILDRYLSPSIRFVAGIPIVLWMPISILLFGTDEGFKVGLLAISTGLLFHTSIFQAVADTERRYLELALLFEKTRWERTRLVLLPAVSGPAFNALRASLTFGWVLLFFLEFAAARQGVEGLGWFVANERQLGRIEQEYAGLAVLGLLAFAIDIGIAKVQARIMSWSDKRQRPLQGVAA